MILIAGIPSEPPVARAIEAAEERGIGHVVFDQRLHQASDVALSLEPSTGWRGRLACPAGEIDLASLSGVYVRLMDERFLPDVATTPSDSQERTRSAGFHAVFHEWLNLAPIRVANRPRAMLSNVSKTYQATIIRRLGFAIPETVVTNDPDKALVLMVAVVISGDFYRRLDKSAMTDRFGKMFERIDGIAGQLRLDWDLTNWAARQQRPDLITLSLYVNACTAPTDRVLVQAYMPQVLALAKRAFAGGHADLRPGFFETEEAQRLTVERLRRQSVPLILLDTGDSLRNFRKSFPIVVEYIEREYRFVGEHVFDERFGISLFVRKDREPTGTWSPLEWPCYNDGRTQVYGGASRAERRIG